VLLLMLILMWAIFYKNFNEVNQNLD